MTSSCVMAEAEFRALAVLQAEHVLAHGGPAAGLLPELARVQRGQVKLLTDPVHLLADDGSDLVQRAARAADSCRCRRRAGGLTRAEKKLVAGDLGVGRSLTQGRNKKLGPTMHCVSSSFLCPRIRRRCDGFRCKS